MLSYPIYNPWAKVQGCMGNYDEGWFPRVPRSLGSKDQYISNLNSNTSLTLKKVHLVLHFAMGYKQYVLGRMVTWHKEWVTWHSGGVFDTFDQPVRSIRFDLVLVRDTFKIKSPCGAMPWISICSFLTDHDSPC